MGIRSRGSMVYRLGSGIRIEISHGVFISSDILSYICSSFFS